MLYLSVFSNACELSHSALAVLCTCFGATRLSLHQYYYSLLALARPVSGTTVNVLSTSCICGIMLLLVCKSDFVVFAVLSRSVVFQFIWNTDCEDASLIHCEEDPTHSGRIPSSILWIKEAPSLKRKPPLYYRGRPFLFTGLPSRAVRGRQGPSYSRLRAGYGSRLCTGDGQQPASTQA
jgi:hypothetical protein